VTSYEWYSTLKKPFFAPPSNVFGPVWGFLYLIIFVSYSYVFYLFFKKSLTVAEVAPFLLNLAFNIAFTPLQFGLKNNYLALVDIILVLITLIWGMFSIYKHSQIVFLAQIPYLLWVLFATALQISITYLNR